MSKTTGSPSDRSGSPEIERRDFLYIATGAMAAVGATISLWPLIESMNPAADVRALSSIEVDLGPIENGQRITVKWRGQPVFIDHRTAEQIARAKADDENSDLIDPATDAARVK